MFSLISLLIFVSIQQCTATQLSVAERYRLDQFAQGAYSSKEVLYGTFDLARRCAAENIPGDFIECGVAAGAQVAAMAYANEKAGTSRTVHLFDSFEGIPLAGPQDTEQPGIHGPITHNVHVPPEELLVSSGITVHSLESVKMHMNWWGIDTRNFVYHKGWFQQTLPETAHTIANIALLRLDGDLYESTKICLEYLYPKISKGGFIIIDDYALIGCRKAVHEYLDKHGLQPVILPAGGPGDTPVYWCVE